LDEILKALLVGGTGYLGSAIVDNFADMGLDVVGISRRGGRSPGQRVIRAIGNLNPHELIHEYQPDVVLLTAGNPDLDACESDVSMSREMNVELVRRWATAIGHTASNITCVLFSSIYVFGQESPKEGLTENDVPLPISQYGKDKLEAEIIVRQHINHHLIIRLPWLLGSPGHIRDPLVGYIRKVMKGEKIELDRNTRFPTDTTWVAACLLHLLHIGSCGTVHLSSKDATNRYELVKELARSLNIDTNGTIGSNGIYPAPNLHTAIAMRPSFLKISTMRNDVRGLPEAPTWKNIIVDRYRNWNF